MSEKLPSAESEQHEVVSGFGFSEDQGPRDSMEDAHAAETELGGNKNRKFFGIYDGHGGKDGADMAAKELHQRVAENLESDAEPSEALRKAFLDTDAAIEKKEDLLDDYFGTTAVVAFFEKGKLWVANVGDARAILVKEDSVVRLSKDHKPTDPDEKTRVEKAGGKITRKKVYKLDGDVYRVDFENRSEQQKLAKREAKFIANEPFRINDEIAMSRALGDRRYKDGLVIADPDIKMIEVKPGDKKLVLACDGVWDVMSDEDVAELIRNEKDPQKAAELIKKKALELETGDNISVMVINLSVAE